MIRPVCRLGNNEKTTFCGIIKDTPLLNQALRNFNKQEKDEFIRLKELAQKTDDGRTYGVYLGQKQSDFDKVKGAYQTVIKYFGMHEEGTTRKDLSEQITSMKISGQLFEDCRAYARAILKPLKDIYGNN